MSVVLSGIDDPGTCLMAAGAIDLWVPGYQGGAGV